MINQPGPVELSHAHFRAVPVKQSRVARPTAKRMAEGNAACLTSRAAAEIRQTGVYFPSASLMEVGGAASMQDARRAQRERHRYVRLMGAESAASTKKAVTNRHKIAHLSA
jgi:hypothetical protein